MPKAYLLLGADIGDKKVTFTKACLLIEESLGHILRESSLYESEAWGFESDTTFLNQVIELETSLPPFDFLEGIHLIECALGRVRSGNGYESRTIDIDILFYGNLVLNTPNLTIPHPRISERMFTLAPLYELIPSYIHPALGKPIKDIYKESKDHSLVRIITS